MNFSYVVDSPTASFRQLTFSLLQSQTIIDRLPDEHDGEYTPVPSVS